jgi:hypothetical protein
LKLTIAEGAEGEEEEEEETGSSLLTIVVRASRGPQILSRMMAILPVFSLQT